VVVGFVETHGRPQTAAQLRDLEIVPRKKVVYRGAELEAMDLDAVLARRPEVALVDELAHTNVPGSGRHAKRWEDVLELLDSGISVITTVNIQHLESLADAVERMTGAPVRERVPDWVVRRADQIELIDSSPAQLRRRILHGNVYPPERIQSALDHFFRAENLTALRELALRFVADETEEEMLEYLHRLGATTVWETKERILAAVAGPGSEAVLRRAARMAARSKGDLLVLYVRVDDSERAAPPERLAEIRALAESVGGTWHEVVADDAASAIVRFATEHQITQILLGSSRRHRFLGLIERSLTMKVLDAAAKAGVDVHVIARAETHAPPSEHGGSGTEAASAARPR